MLKKVITYEDFDGNSRTEDFYFNLSKTELTEMDANADGGLAELLRRIVAAGNTKELFATFKQIILSSYGAKSDDGKRFFKSAEISQDFIASPAFDILFMELVTDDVVAAEFIKGVLPAEYSQQVANAMATVSTPAVVEVPTPVDES
jgi:hypothetical protein